MQEEAAVSGNSGFETRKKMCSIYLSVQHVTSAALKSAVVVWTVLGTVVVVGMGAGATAIEKK